MRRQLSTTAPWRPAGALALLSALFFLALLLASRTAPDFSESHGCFCDTLLLSRFLFDPPQASGRKSGRFLPRRHPAGTARRDGQGCRTAKRQEPEANVLDGPEHRGTASYPQSEIVHRVEFKFS
jgi:hypothetical protein